MPLVVVLCRTGGLDEVQGWTQYRRDGLDELVVDGGQILDIGHIVVVVV